MKTDGSNGGGAQNGAVATKEEAPKTLQAYLETKRASFAAILPRGMTIDRFMKVVMMAIMKTPALAKADFRSMLQAVAQCATYGLEPDGHHAAIVPFRNGALSNKAGGDVYDAVFMPMVHGLIALAFRTGLFRSICAREVYKEDLFEYAYDFDNTFRHVPAEGERGELRGVYAFYVMKDGGRDFIYMSVADYMAWGKRYAKSFSKPDSLWQVNPMAAGLKTVVRRVLHFAPMAIEMPSDYDSGDMRNVTPVVDAPAVFDIGESKGEETAAEESDGMLPGIQPGQREPGSD